MIDTHYKYSLELVDSSHRCKDIVGLLTVTLLISQKCNCFTHLTLCVLNSIYIFIT